MERRGFFFVDQVAFSADKKIRLHYIPDGKTKGMSVISHKLDQKEVAGGKGKAEGANKAEAKKLQAATTNVDGTVTEEGTPAVVSKKEAKKQAKKDQKKATKAAGGKPTAEAGAEEKKEVVSTEAATKQE